MNGIDTSGFVLETKYDADKTEVENKFLILVGLVKRQIIMLKSLKLTVKYQVLVG